MKFPLLITFLITIGPKASLGAIGDDFIFSSERWVQVSPQANPISCSFFRKRAAQELQRDQEFYMELGNSKLKLNFDQLDRLRNLLLRSHIVSSLGEQEVQWEGRFSLKDKSINLIDNHILTQIESNLINWPSSDHQTVKEFNVIKERDGVLLKVQTNYYQACLVENRFVLTLLTEKNESLKLTHSLSDLVSPARE
jgi:hypothetical protein